MTIVRKRRSMKYLKQFGLILLVAFLAEGMRYAIPAPIPASIYGLFILFLALRFRVIKLSQVEETGDFLLEIMPLTFLPAAVALVESWEHLHSILLPAILLILVGTALTMGATGGAAQFALYLQERSKKR